MPFTAAFAMSSLDPNNLQAVPITCAAGFSTATSTGVLTFALGGSIAVGNNQAAGSYAGTFTLTVSY